MRTKLAAATALAGSLAMATFIWASAQATPAPLPTQAPSNGIVTLVGGGGHGGGHGGGGGGRGGGGGGGRGGGGAGDFARCTAATMAVGVIPALWRIVTLVVMRPEWVATPIATRPPIAVPDTRATTLNRAGPGGGRLEHGDRGRFAERHDHADRDRGRFAERHDRGHDHGDHNRHFAERHDNHDHDRFHHRHRVFRNGVWVWVYGPDYYSYGDDCWWLLRQAGITGSPYWWSRYNACVGYY